jgi:glycosyltransferase domain-containing protein
VLILLLQIVIVFLVFGLYHHVRTQRKRTEREMATLKKSILGVLGHKSQGWRKDLAALPGSTHHMRLIKSVRRRWINRACRNLAPCNSHPNLEKLTLVIPTHNRHPYLARVLDYYKGWKVRLIIADSSTTAFTGTMPPHVEYRHLPGVSYASKFEQVLPDIQTPYLLLAADDDFIALAAVIKAIDYMGVHPECSCAQGWHAEFTRYSGQIVQWMAAHIFATNYRIDGATAASRLNQQASLYMNNFYALHRTEVLRDCFCRVIPKLPQEVLARRADMMELAQAFTTVIWGTHIILPMLWIGREKMPVSLGNSCGSADDGAREKDVQILLLALAELLKDHFDGEDAVAAFEEAGRKFKTYSKEWSNLKVPHFGQLQEFVRTSADLAGLTCMERAIRNHPIPLGSSSN